MNQNQLDAMYIIENFILLYCDDSEQRAILLEAVPDYVERPEIVKELKDQRGGLEL